MIKTGIPGQWELNLGLEYKDKEIKDSELSIIEPEKLDEFYMMEELYNSFPYFKISFRTSDSWRKYWNENSNLKISLSMGDGSKKILDTKVAILKKDCTDVGNGYFSYTAEGLYTGDKSALAMCQTPYIRLVGPCIGTECIEKCAEPFFKKVVNEAESKGKMPWYQCNEPTKPFLDRVIQHSYIEGSFVITAITMNGEYRIIDVVKACGKDENWTIGKGGGGKDFGLIKSPEFRANTGIMNSLGGYGLELPIVSMEYGVRTQYHPEIKIGLSGKEPPQIKNIPRKTLAPAYFSGANETQEYIKAPVNYEYGKTLLSMEKIDFVTLMMDQDIKVGDILKVYDITSNGGNTAQDTSGKYMVEKVIRGILNHLAQIRVIATRDSGLQQ